jgi:hypothetical protein
MIDRTVPPSTSNALPFVAEEVVGKFIERGDLDFHPQGEVISWTESVTATRKKISSAAPKETSAAGKVTPSSVQRAVAANSFASLYSKRPQRSVGHYPP